jgi:hypothetical protein
MTEQDITDPCQPPLPERLRQLVRFGHRALRITASTLSVVALLRQKWIPAGAFGVAWLLLLQTPRLSPVLDDAPATDQS